MLVILCAITGKELVSILKYYIAIIQSGLCRINQSLISHDPWELICILINNSTGSPAAREGLRKQEGGAEKQEGGCVQVEANVGLSISQKYSIYERQIYVAICFSTYFDAYQSD